MAETPKQDLGTSVPRIKPEDLKDPTLYALNRTLEEMLGHVSRTAQSTSALERKVFRRATVPIPGYTPPTAGGEGFFSPLDPPAQPTGVEASLVTSPGGDRFGFRVVWTPPSPIGGTITVEFYVHYYDYDSGAGTWTTDASGDIPLGGVDVQDEEYESSYWPLPDHTQRARLWFRALNGVDEATEWTEAGYASPGYIEIDPSTLSTGTPGEPTSPDVTVLSKDGNYGLKSTWTRPSPLGTAKEYEIQFGFWTNSACAVGDGDIDNTDADKNWSQSFFDDGTTLNGAVSEMVSGWWPRPTDASRWVKMRVRAVNTIGGATSDWVYSTTAREITAYTDSYVPPEAPNPPTAVTLSIIGSEGNFGFDTGWTAPSPLGGTVGYEVQARYWTNEGLSTPESDWITLGGTWLTSLESGFWPRPSANRWVKVRVAAKNEINELSSWVELSAAVLLEPLATPGAPTSVSASVVPKDDNYGISTSWTAPSPIGTAKDYEVHARFFTDPGLSSADSDWIPLGGTFETALVSGFWPRPTDATKYGKVRVRSLNALKGYSAWVESTGFTVSMAPSVAPAPNISSVTAFVAQSGNQWGFSGTITWPANRTEIDHVNVYVVGPIGTAEERSQLWDVISPPVSGNTTLSQAAEWVRPSIGESNQQYRLEVESYNGANVPTASPVASSNFTVTAMSNSLTVTGLTAARNATTKNIDGVEVYGVTGQFTIPNDSEIDHAEVFIRNTSDANDKERGPATSTTPGTINTVVSYATDLWTLYGTSAFTLRVTVYLLNKDGARIGSGVYADVTITPGSGGLDGRRLDPTRLGAGVINDGTALRVVAGDNDNMILNPSFEDLVNGSPKDWGLNYGAYVLEDEYVWSGKKSLILGTLNANAYAAMIPVRPGDVLQGEFEWQCTSAPNVPTARIYAGIICYDKNQAWFDSGSGDAFNSGHPDDYLSIAPPQAKTRVTATIPAGVSFVQLFVGLEWGVALINGGHYRVDNAMLRRINSATPTGNAPAGLSLNSSPYPTAADKNGIQGWYVYATWTPETQTPTRSDLEFFYAYTNADWSQSLTVLRPIGKGSIEQGALDCVPQNYGASTQYAKVWAYLLSKDGTRAFLQAFNLTIPASPANALNLGNASTGSIGNGITLDSGKVKVNADSEFTFDGNGKLVMSTVNLAKATNFNDEFEILGGLMKMKKIDLGKALGFDSGEFEVYYTGSTYVFRMKTLSADKLLTGTLQVGGGGSKVSLAKWFNASGQLYGYIGSGALAGYSGSDAIDCAWFKRLLIGGSSPSAAKIACDESGNVTISGNLIAGGALVSTTVAASLISAGTISASVSLTSPTISVSGGFGSTGFTVNIDSTNAVKVTSSSTGRVQSMGYDGFASSYPSTGRAVSVSDQSVIGSTSGLTRYRLYQDSGQSICDVVSPDGASLVRTIASNSLCSIASGASSAAVSFSGSNAYCFFTLYRFTIQNTGSNDVPATFTNWIAAYNSSGTYIGKIPLF